jgi:hypothetical protein
MPLPALTPVLMVIFMIPPWIEASVTAAHHLVAGLDVRLDGDLLHEILLISRRHCRRRP